MDPSDWNSGGFFKPEMALALLCARAELEPAEQTRLTDLIEGGIRWPLFMQLVRKDRLFPLVYRRFKTLLPSGIPPSVWTQLQSLDQSGKRRMLQMTGEMLNISRSLGERGVRTVILKGIPLAYLLYGDIACRTANDIDLLLDPGHMEEAGDIVGALGYRMEQAVSPGLRRWLPAWTEQTHSCCYFHTQRQIGLDLTCRLGTNGTVMAREDIEPCVEAMVVAGQSVLMLKREVLLLHLMLHGAGHVWFRLKWLVDIDRMVRQGEFSWAVLQQLADRQHCRRLVSQSLLLAYRLLDTPLPPEVLQQAAGDVSGQKLAAQAIGLIGQPDFNPVLQGLFPWRRFYRYKQYRLGMLHGWRKKMQYLLVEAFTIALVLSAAGWRKAGLIPGACRSFWGKHWLFLPSKVLSRHTKGKGM